MISFPRLARLAEAADYDRLLDEVTRNGRPLPLGIRMRLSEPESLPSAALGLALRRVVQLTYRPVELSATLVRELLGLQRADGSFGTIGATAVAAAAMLALLDQVRALPRAWANLERVDSARGLHEARAARVQPLNERVEHACLTALHAIHQFQQQSASLTLDGPDGLIGDTLDSAIVLWQLGEDQRLIRSIRFDDLISSALDAGMAHDHAAGPLVERVLSPSRAPWG